MANRLDLVTQNTAEIVTLPELKSLLKKKNPTSYWGVAPTGPPHIGYYRTIAKQLDLVKAGFKHRVLIADVHAYMDDRKSPWSELETRGKIYQKCFELLGMKGKNVQYVRGSTFQLKPDYLTELLKSMPLVTVKRATRAASEVTRMKNPKVSELVYPMMQTLDCWGLDTDLAYGGTDQRHIYMLSRDVLKKLGHKVPALIFTDLGISLSGDKKMSASEKHSRLELYASEDRIRKAIMGAFCPAKTIKGNPVVDYAKYWVLQRTALKITRKKEHGGNLVIKDIAELERKYAAGQIHPLDLKASVAEHLIEILKPIRNYFKRNPKLLKTFDK